jgi:hypothetical protein
MLNKLLLVEEVAARLGLTPPAILDLIRAGDLPAIVVPPDVIRIAPQHLSRFLRARTSPFTTSLAKLSGGESA